VNQRFAGIVTNGTNLPRSESERLDVLIQRADRILKTINYRRAAERVKELRQAQAVRS
jgi:hypothetical protein